MAFTEHGAIMAANVLNSLQAVKMSVFVVRAFILMRKELISWSELERRLLKVESILLAMTTTYGIFTRKSGHCFFPRRSPKRQRNGLASC
jgi:hypothetical protein